MAIRRLLYGWVVVVLGVAVASGAGAAPAVASTASDLTLLKRYEPVVVYPSQENWRPMDALSFSPQTTLQRYGCKASKCGWRTLVSAPQPSQLPAGSCAASSINKSSWVGCDRLNVNSCDYGGAFTTSPLTRMPAT